MIQEDYKNCSCRPFLVLQSTENNGQRERGTTVKCVCRGTKGKFVLRMIKISKRKGHKISETGCSDR